MDLPAFGAELRRLRRRARLNQQDLATRAGVSVRTIRNLEVGRTQPRQDSVLLLTRALGLTGADLRRFQAAAGLAPGPAGVSQLPRDLPDFGDREPDVAAVVGALTAPSGTVNLVAVTGPAGVGKTALAVHVAHRLRDRFPDGQLHVRMRTAAAAPLTASEVLGRFLRALGLDGSAVPPDPDERAALYRTRLAGRRLLVLVDDAGDEAQVRPLLPGDGGNAVLLTARRPLVGLEGVRTVALDVLAPARASRLLGRIAGPERVTAEPDAARRIVAACGGLPLALRVSGARLAAEPGGSLAALADLLTDERGRLDQLAAGDLGVRASLAVGHRELDEPARRAFRRLGLLPGTDLPAWTVAAVLDTDPATAAGVARRLVRTGLLERTGEDRYGLHDLVRLYAREQPEPDADAVVRRALAGWAALADAADRRLPSDVLPLGDRLPAGARADPATEAGLADRPLEWFERERPGLVAAVRLAVTAAPDLGAALADSLVDFCATRDYPDDWAAVVDALAEVADRTGDVRLAGHAARRRAELAMYRSDGTALAHAERAVELARAAGDRRDRGAARFTYGAALRLAGRTAESLAVLEKADDDLVAAGDLTGSGHVRNELGMSMLELGDTGAAGEHFRVSAERLRAGGDLRGETRVLISLGNVDRRAGDLDSALTHLGRARELGLRLGDRTLAVTATVVRGRLLAEHGDPAEAVEVLSEALAASRELHRPDSVGVAGLFLGEAYLRLGRAAEAREQLSAARELLAGIGLVVFEGMAEGRLGDVALAEDDRAGARTRWRRAARILDQAAPTSAAEFRAKLADAG